MSGLDTILDEVLHLPPPLRAYLAEQLLESLDRDTDAVLPDAWRETLMRRAQEVEEGLITLLPAEQVFKDAHKALE